LIDCLIEGNIRPLYMYFYDCAWTLLLLSTNGNSSISRILLCWQLILQSILSAAGYLWRNINCRNFHCNYNRRLSNLS